MTFKNFTKYYISIVLSLIVLSIITNYYIDPFSLFNDKVGKNHRVYVDEKSSKYLYSFNYIPKNFNGILVGSSISDLMMDTRKINDYDVYNLSLNGGNISELKYAIDNVIEYGNMKIFIICLDPYMTIDSGTKSSQINPKEYYGSLGSLFLYKYYYKKYNISDEDDKLTRNSYWGYLEYGESRDNNASTLAIDKAIKEKLYHSGFFKIDKIAYNELEEILKKVRKENIKIVAYYFPRPKRIFSQKDFNISYGEYKIEIDKLLKYDDDIVINFNQTKYDYIRDKDSSYTGSDHLSKIGAEKIIQVLNKNILKMKL